MHCKRESDFIISKIISLYLTKYPTNKTFLKLFIYANKICNENILKLFVFPTALCKKINKKFISYANV